MRYKLIFAIAAMSLAVLLTNGALGQQRAQGPRGGRGEGAAAPDAPANKTSFWSNEDIQNRWKENEAKKTINSRLFNGPYNISTNVRIVLPDDPPQTHETTADLWIIAAGTATAETDGEMEGKTIHNGMRRAVHAGDINFWNPTDSGRSSCASIPFRIRTRPFVKLPLQRLRVAEDGERSRLPMRRRTKPHSGQMTIFRTAGRLMKRKRSQTLACSMRRSAPARMSVSCFPTIPR